MLRDLGENEMKAVSGGHNIELELRNLQQDGSGGSSNTVRGTSVTGTRSTGGGVPTNPDPFGFSGVSGTAFLNSIGLGLETNPTILTGDSAREFLDMLDTAQANGNVSVTTTTTIETTIEVEEDNSGSISGCLDTFLGCFRIPGFEWP